MPDSLWYLLSDFAFLFNIENAQNSRGGFNLATISIVSSVGMRKTKVEKKKQISVLNAEKKDSGPAKTAERIYPHIRYATPRYFIGLAALESAGKYI